MIIIRNECDKIEKNELYSSSYSLAIVFYILLITTQIESKLGHPKFGSCTVFVSS